ncbi:MAG: gas vesicle protein GvpG [Streptosporangiales bacterium]|nr:gas vesicle protein GvpG [Streptosporangiales bacterium]MBO0889693.1 gas vesicle protein GvpG [Acidothermales bacterium]
MGLFTGLLTLPLAPVRGVVWVADKVREAAEQEQSDPAVIRQRLDEVERAREAGEIDADEAAELEEQLIARLME